MFDFNWAFLGLFQTIGQDFAELSLIEKISFLATVGVPLLAPAVFFYRKSHLKDIEKQTLETLSQNRADQIKKQERKIIDLTEQIQSLESWRLEVRLENAEKERQDGNEERAIQLLRTGVEAIRDDLATCCLELAGHHVSLIHDYGERHGIEAERLARIATLLRPSDQEGRALLAEILTIQSVQAQDRAHYPESDALWDEAADFINVGDDLGSIDTLVNIALDCYKKGQYRLAERVYRRVIKMSERHLEPDAEQTLIFRNDHAQCVGKSRRYQDALELFKALLPVQEQVLGQNHPDTLMTRHNIAFLTGQTGDTEKALELFKDLLPIQEQASGQDHPNTLMTRHNIAFLTGQTGDTEKALELFKDLLPVQEQVLGQNHPDTLRTRQKIAAWTGKTGDTEKALELFKDLLPVQEQVMGQNHPETLVIRHNIAFWTGKTGDVEKALELFKDLLPIQEQVLGQDHPDTVPTRNEFERLKSKDG